MKKKIKTLLSMLLVVAMVSSMVPTVFATTSAEVSVSEKAVGNGIYKLVFSAKSSVGNMDTSAIVMSYDNTIIQPVDASKKTDITPTDKDTDSIDMFVAAEKINVAGVEWSIKDTRSAFAVSVSTANPTKGTDISAGVPLVEFYFRLATGKTTADMKKGTFRLEKDYSEGSFLKTLFSTQAEAKAWMLGFKDSTILGYGDANAADTMTLTSFTYTNSDVQKLGTLALTLDNPAVTVGLGNTVVTPKVTALDTEGEAMATPALTWSIEGTPTGVSIDPATGVVTVDKSAKTGTVTIKATSGDGVTDTATIAITRADAVATTVTVDGAASIEVPTGDTAKTETYTATVTDQYGDAITNPTVTWSATGATAGVTIDASTGVVSVTNAAKAAITDATGTALTVTAKVNGTEVQGTATITVKR
ncbi:MAG: hypothetical protein RR336_02475, partial [Oscillospiraceae bacterium]